MINSVKEFSKELRYTPAELARRIDEYFKLGGKVLEDGTHRLYTIGELLAFLGLSKSRFEEYRGRRQYEGIITGAFQLLENNIVELSLMRLIDRVMTIFCLKNLYEWTDQPDKGGDLPESINFQFTVKDLSKTKEFKQCENEQQKKSGS